MKNRINILSPAEKVDMADEWYEYANEDHFWIHSRYRSIIKALKPLTFKDKNILEIGCGNAVVVNQIERDTDQLVDGCDLNFFALEKAKKTKGSLYCLNIYDRPESLIGKYDYILLLDVIEHLDDDLDFLKTSLEYLKKDGVVIINVPALDYLFSKYDKIAGHKRRYNIKMMKKLLSNGNLDINFIGYWGMFLVPIALVRKLVLKYISKEKTIVMGFKPPNLFINFIFKMMVSLENFLFKSSPIGTSLIAIGRKRNIQE